MSGVNKVILIGRVGKDVEVNQLNNGSAVATFSLATSETYKDKAGNKKESTEWHQIKAWRGLAEIASKYVKKGDMVSVIGKLTHRSFDKNDGTKGYATEVVIDELQILSGKKPQGSEQPAAVASETATDDLPY